MTLYNLDRPYRSCEDNIWAPSFTAAVLRRITQHYSGGMMWLIDPSRTGGSHLDHVSTFYPSIHPLFISTVKLGERSSTGIMLWEGSWWWCSFWCPCVRPKICMIHFHSSMRLFVSSILGVWPTVGDTEKHREPPPTSIYDGFDENPTLYTITRWLRIPSWSFCLLRCTCFEISREYPVGLGFPKIRQCHPRHRKRLDSL